MAPSDDRTPPTLDYSSPGQERRQEDDREAARRQALHDYNESTFGEREPFLLWPFLVFLPATIVVCLWLQPPRWGTRLAILATVAVCWYWSRIAGAVRTWADARRR